MDVIKVPFKVVAAWKTVFAFTLIDMGYGMVASLVPVPEGNQMWNSIVDGMFSNAGQVAKHIVAKDMNAYSY